MSVPWADNCIVEENGIFRELWFKGSYRMASSNTFFNPFWVRAEHSKYLFYEKVNIRENYRTALISFAICMPWGYVIGAWRFSRSFSIVSRSSRRSSFVPTRIIGILGAWCEISGNHYHYHQIPVSRNKYLCFDVFEGRRRDERETD